MSGPRPLCVEIFYNRADRIVSEGEVLFVGALDTTGLYDLMNPSQAHLCSDVRVRVLRAGADNCAVEAEVGLPHALHWKAARGG